MKGISVLTYNCRHRKTYDTLCLLKVKGYCDVKVYGQPMTYEKKHKPLLSHRPDLPFEIPHPRIMCQNLGYKYIEGRFTDTIEDDADIFLLCGAGILPREIVSRYRIINSHPGYIPLARGLDAYKWSLYCRFPVGVTTHILGDYVDGGEILERREIEIREYDTFHSVARRVYENEIDMLVHGIEIESFPHEYVKPSGVPFRRMPPDIEKRLIERYGIGSLKRMENPDRGDWHESG